MGLNFIDKNICSLYPIDEGIGEQMIFIREVNLPSCISGVTLEDNQKDYNVYINYAKSYNEKKATLEHELCHILGGDFNRFDDSVEQIEADNRQRSLAEFEIEDEIQYLGYCEIPNRKDQ